MIYEPCLILKPDMVAIADSARLDSFCKVEGGLGVVIGECVHISSFCHLNIGGGALVIGAYAACASGAKILSGTNAIDGISMSAAAPQDMQSVKRLTTTISTFAFIGTNAVIMPGVTIGRGAVVGAGAVVTKDVAPGAIVAGIPARKIGQRENYPS